jgi:hypothetical protein
MHDVRVLADLNVRIGDAESVGDVAFLESVLAPKLAFRRANDTCVGRDEFLAAVKPGTPRATVIEAVHLFGSKRAIVTCRVTTDTGSVREAFHNVRLFIRSEDGAWKLLGWANERL